MTAMHDDDFSGRPMTANASPAVLAPVDVELLGRLVDSLRRDAEGSRGGLVYLTTVANQIERLAAALAAAREDAATWREQHATCTRDLQNADRRLKAAEADAARLDWLVANVKEQLTAGSLKGEQPIEHKTQYVLPVLIAWADFCGQIGFREAIDIARGAIHDAP